MIGCTCGPGTCRLSAVALLSRLAVSHFEPFACRVRLVCPTHVLSMHGPSRAFMCGGRGGVSWCRCLAARSTVMLVLCSFTTAGAAYPSYASLAHTWCLDVCWAVASRRPCSLVAPASQRAYMCRRHNMHIKHAWSHVHAWCVFVWFVCCREPAS